MLGVVLKNTTPLQGFQHIAEKDVLLSHLLLGMLGHSELLPSCLLCNSPLDEPEVVCSQSTSLNLASKGDSLLFFVTRRAEVRFC